MGSAGAIARRPSAGHGSAGRRATASFSVYTLPRGGSCRSRQGKDALVSTHGEFVNGQYLVSEDALASAEAAVQHQFADRGLLARALTHASIAEERTASNERMEFLGDSVLGAIVAERIYHRFPDLLEGEMTKIKSSVVSRQTCATIARDLGLDQLLIIGKGMQQSDSMPHSLAAAVLESVIAAIYLDAGYAAAERFIGRQLDPYIQRARASGHQENFKSVLQQHAQQHDLETPAYRVLDEKGPDHSKCFKVSVEIGSRRFTASWGQSKKQAEQAAALLALTELGLVEQTADGLVRVVTPPAV
jgi:ribonuclease III